MAAHGGPWRPEAAGAAGGDEQVAAQAAFEAAGARPAAQLAGPGARSGMGAGAGAGAPRSSTRVQEFDPGAVAGAGAAVAHGVVGRVVERPAASAPPRPPGPPASSGRGFPVAVRRSPGLALGRPGGSRFAQQASAARAPGPTGAPPLPVPAARMAGLRANVEVENRRQLAEMGENERREALAEVLERLPAKHVEFLRARGQQKSAEREADSGGPTPPKRMVEAASTAASADVPAPPSAKTAAASPVHEPRLGLGGELRGWGGGAAGLEPMARDMLRTDGDPEGEGYTLEELTALSVSRVAAQRAASMEILGKFFRNGRSSLPGASGGTASGSVTAAQEWALGPGGVPRVLRRSLADPSPRVRAAALVSLRLLASLACPPALLHAEALCPSLHEDRPLPVCAMDREGGRGAWRPLFRPRQPGSGREEESEPGPEDMRRDPWGFLVFHQALASGVVQAAEGLDVDDSTTTEALRVLSFVARHSPAAVKEASDAGAREFATSCLVRALGGFGAEASEVAQHAVQLLRLLSEGGCVAGAASIAQVKATLHKHLHGGPDGQTEGAALACLEVFRLWGKFLWDDDAWSADELWPLLQQILQCAVEELRDSTPSTVGDDARLRAGAQLFRCLGKGLQRRAPGLSSPCSAAVLDEAVACLETVASRDALGEPAKWPLVSAALEYVAAFSGAARGGEAFGPQVENWLNRCVKVACREVEDRAGADGKWLPFGMAALGGPGELQREAMLAELAVTVLRTRNLLHEDTVRLLQSLSFTISHHALDCWPRPEGNGLSTWGTGASGEALSEWMRRGVFFHAVCEAQLAFPEGATVDVVVRLPTIAPPGQEARVRRLMDMLHQMPGRVENIATVVSAWKETWVPENVKAGLAPLPPEWPLIGLSEVQMGGSCSARAAAEKQMKDKLICLLRGSLALEAESDWLAHLPEALKVTAVIPQVFLASGSLFLEEEVQCLTDNLLRRWASPKSYAGSAKAWFTSQEAMDLCEAFCATSYGDRLFGQCVALCLARNESGATVRGAWNVLRENLGFHLLPPAGECLLGEDSYDWSGDQQLVALFAEGLSNGDLDRALDAGSLPAHVALHSVARACFPDDGEPGASDGGPGPLQNKIRSTLASGQSRAWLALLPVSDAWRSLLASDAAQ